MQLKSAEEMALQSALAQKTLMAELAACQAEMADIANLTIEDELKKNPEIAKQIEKEIDEDQWFVL